MTEQDRYLAINTGIQHVKVPTVLIDDLPEFAVASSNPARALFVPAEQANSGPTDPQPWVDWLASVGLPPGLIVVPLVIYRDVERRLVLVTTPRERQAGECGGCIPFSVLEHQLEFAPPPFPATELRSVGPGSCTAHNAVDTMAAVVQALAQRPAPRSAWEDFA